jgi:hypothetical protein
MEIDENLMRANLSPAERAADQAERKEIMKPSFRRPGMALRGGGDQRVAKMAPLLRATQRRLRKKLAHPSEPYAARLPVVKQSRMSYRSPRHSLCRAAAPTCGDSLRLQSFKILLAREAAIRAGRHRPEMLRGRLTYRHSQGRPWEKRARCGIAIFQDIDAQRAGGDGRLGPAAGAAMELMPAASATELSGRAATAQRNPGRTPQADRLTVHHPFSASAAPHRAASRPA